MESSRRVAIKLGALAGLVGFARGQGLGRSVDENREVKIEIESIKGLIVNVVEFTNATPDIVLSWFFDCLVERFGIDFSPLLEEQKSPISFSRWKSNRLNHVTLRPGNRDAFDVFDSIIKQSMWHWSYSKSGQVVIHAWHQGDLEK